MLKLGFYGAAGEVTGSCYLITTDRARVLVDFGVHQGDPSADRKNATLPPISPQTLDAVVLTHAHLDHIGRMPLLVKNGYRARIFTTQATVGVGAIILRDAARIQESDADYRRRHTPPEVESDITPLYTSDDVERVLRLFTPVGMETTHEVAPGITIRFIEAGHILGAAEVHITVRHGPRGELTSTIMFSGDVGVVGSPILRDPAPANAADFAVLESTYGDRDHRPLADTLAEFLDILKTTQPRCGKILIPAFAVGRTQDVLYHIGDFVRAGQLSGITAVVDSPMAAEVSTLYRRHVELYDREAQALLDGGLRPIDFPGLAYTRTREESQRLNDSKECAVIIAASGMCTGGRIVHHLKHHLWKPETRVVIVGFQAEGTLGRRLVDGDRHVRILGDSIPVRATIHTLGGFSAHAGQSGLLDWARPLAGSVKRLFLTHGEDGPRAALRDKLAPILGLTPELPTFGEVVQLA